MPICGISLSTCIACSTRPKVPIQVRSLLKSLGSLAVVQQSAAFVAAMYLKLVQKTTRYTVEPADFRDSALASAPVIGALWHGQHLMTHFAWPRGMPVAALISRNRDAQINALVLERLGVTAIRGSGGRVAQKMHRRGGASALREMLRTLEDGQSLVLTADVPKVSRICGNGIIALARLSGRPILPVAVVNRWRIDFNSWDKASIGLPFGRGAIVVGAALQVPADASKEAQEEARQHLETALDAVYERAYALAGSKDPGAKSNSHDAQKSDAQKSGQTA